VNMNRSNTGWYRFAVAFIPALCLLSAPLAISNVRADAKEDAQKIEAAKQAEVEKEKQIEAEKQAEAEKAKQAEAAKQAEIEKAKQAEQEKAQAEKEKENEAKSKESESSKSQSTPSPVQSPVRPLGLNVVDKVQVGGSDDSSKTFQTAALPDLSKLINERLSETRKVDDSAMLLDPSKLQLKTTSDVRVYFVGEGAGYANTLGFTTDGSGKSGSQTAELIFPNASSSVSSYDPAASVKRTEKEPLLPGDFVNLGQHKGGTALDFFLIANGANGGRDTFSTQKSANPDGINHVVSFAYAVKNSSYLIIGFEDLFGGGDRDFNDVVFAVDIGKVNIGALTGTPEPATVATLGAFLGLGWVMVRRNKNATR